MSLGRSRRYRLVHAAPDAAGGRRCWPLSLVFRQSGRGSAVALSVPACCVPLGSPVPVVVVGNLTVGGVGKTPLVLALADALTARGWHPAHRQPRLRRRQRARRKR